MPLRLLQSPASTDTTSRTGGGLRLMGDQADTATDTPAPTETSPSESSWLPYILGGATLAGGALLARSPIAPASIRNGLEYANALRQQAMLAGLAPVKSALGNVGAAISASAEARSLDPLKALLSMDTVRDAISTFKSNPKMAQGVTLPGVLGLPGRVMQSLDTATQNALVRGGLTADDAERAVMQAPLPKGLSDALDNPIMRYAIPFRRTPFNQFIEGGKAMGSGRDLPVLAAYGAAGAAHGAATADEQYPVSLSLGVAGAAKYGVPYALAALVGRSLAGGKGPGNIASGVLPVSEYGISQSMENPGAPFGLGTNAQGDFNFDLNRMAAVRALNQLTGR